MVKKLNPKTLSSDDKKDKSAKHKLKKKQEKEEEDFEEEEEIDEENEDDEEEEEADNSFIANDDEEESYDKNDRYLYRNENLFKERDKKEAEKQKREKEKKSKKDKNENISEDEKDNYIEEEPEQEEAELSENLNESDKEVIQEKKPKKKRLHKVADRDNEELKKEFDDLKDGLENLEREEKRKSSIDNYNNSEDEYYEKNRNINKKKKNNLDLIDTRKDNRKNRDDDFIDYGGQQPRRRDKDISKTEKTQLLEQEFISEEDKIIINEDYPERILTRYKLEELPTLSQEIKPEVEWICEQKNYNDSPNKKKKIATLLELYKKEFYDIPYIITYKYYIFEHDLQRKELWEIFELDKEYQKLMDFKKKVINNYNTLEPYLNEKVFHTMKEKYIDNAKTIQELNNMMNYINYNKEKYLSSNSNIHSEENVHQGPIRKSVLAVYFSENLDECAKQFCLDSNDIASNIELIKNKENLSKLLHPPEPECSLTDLLQSCKNSNLTESQFMENICNLIGKEMINHPYIKEFVYEYLRNNCYVSTNPTEEGKKTLDVFHPSFRTKRIRERPIKTFSEDDLFLDILQREKEKLIEVSIQIKEHEEESKEFKYIFSQALNSDQNNIIDNNYNYGIKQEKDLDENDNMNYNGSNKSDWYILRENVIKIFFESINKQFLIDIKKELKEKAESYVIRLCSENFYKLLMSGPYLVNISDLYENKRKELENLKKKQNNEEKKKKKNNYYNENDFNNEIQNIDETDAKFRDDELPKVMSFIYDPNENQTYCVALNQNGEVIDEKIFYFNFTKKNRTISSKQNQNQNQEDSLRQDQELCMKFIEKHAPNLIVIGANDLKARFIKEQITSITSHKSFSLSHHYIYTIFGDLSIPSIYSNSPISESEFPKQNMYIKQAISLGRYQQNPLQEILQLWREDKNENDCLKIKLHPMQKYVDQFKLMEKMENKAIEVVNLCGFDINKAFEFRHLRNTLMFISGFGPRKAKAFIKQLYAQGKPKTRQEILEEKNYNIGPKLGASFINFIKIKTDITSNNNFNEEEYNLLDMTRIPIESYDLAKKFINDIFKKEENNKKQKKKIENDVKIEEIIRYPDKLDILDINEYIKNQSENLNYTEIEKLKFSLKLIKEELTNPFRDLRDPRKDLYPQQIFHLLIGDENFQVGMITVAKVIRIDTEHVQCKLQNDLPATVWFKDIFEDSPENEKISKEKVKSLFKPGSAFEARIKSIDCNNYKADLITRPSEMISHKNYIPNVEKISNFFELTDEDKKNIPYINAHSQKNKKYQPRNIKFEKFKNMSYTDCCNYLRNKDIGECVFRPSSIGNNNLTLSYKFYKQIICHLDIVEEEKLPGENIGKKLRISNETYSSLEEILKRYVVPCAQLIKESIKNRKFIPCDTKSDFENRLKEDKKKQTSIINYNYTILKDYPAYIVLGYVPKVNPIYEYIKIKPKGLYFHEKFFSSLDEITNYFKKEYSTEKYREMVRKSVIPTVQYHRSLETNNNSINLEDSGNKYYSNYSMGSNIGLKEGSNYGINRNKDDRICNICKKPGHIAKNCKNKDNFDRRRDNRNNNSGYLGGKRNRDNRDRDNYEFKKERHDNSRFDWSSNNRDKDKDYGNRNFKKDKNDDDWGKDNDSWGGSQDKNNNNRNNRNNNNEWGSSNNYNVKKNEENDDDAWGTSNNENKNNNLKSENNNNNNDDGW